MGKQGQIYIRGFPRGFKQSDLKDLFRDFGDIREVKMIGTAYAFVTYEKQSEGEAAVDKMDGYQVDDHKLTVEVAGKRGKTSGPQPDDICRLCGGKGHWKNSCPDRRSRYRSRYSRSRSSSSDRRSRNKHRKHRSDRRRRRSRSSSSSRSSSESRSSSSSRSSDRRRKDRKKDKKSSRNDKRERSETRRKEDNNNDDKSENSSVKDDRK